MYSLRHQRILAFNEVWAMTTQAEISVEQTISDLNVLAGFLPVKHIDNAAVIQAIAHLQRLQEVEAVIKAHDPGKAPCGCCEQGKYGEGIWSYSCDCQNYGDCAEAAAWCREKNSYQKLCAAISAGEGKDGSSR